MVQKLWFINELDITTKEKYLMPSYPSLKYTFNEVRHSLAFNIMMELLDRTTLHLFTDATY